MKDIGSVNNEEVINIRSEIGKIISVKPGSK
jgi:hypothetical protein